MKMLKVAEVYTLLSTSHENQVNALIERFNEEILKNYLAESYTYTQIFFRIDDIFSNASNRQAIHIFRNELEKFWNVESLDVRENVLEGGNSHKYIRITINN